jgi:hypothetical protein
MLCHPNIIQYYENFLEDKALMIVMEYAQGILSLQCLPRPQFDTFVQIIGYMT